MSIYQNVCIKKSAIWLIFILVLFFSLLHYLY